MHQRKIAETAIIQLRMWQDFATQFVLTREGAYYRCPMCGQSVIQIMDIHDNEFVYTDEERQALTVAHLRQRHADLEVEVYSGIQ